MKHKKQKPSSRAILRTKTVPDKSGVLARVSDDLMPPPELMQLRRVKKGTRIGYYNGRAFWWAHASMNPGYARWGGWCSGGLTDIGLALYPNGGSIW